MFLCRRCAHLCLERAVSQNDAAGRVTGARKIGREMARGALLTKHVFKILGSELFFSADCVSHILSPSGWQRNQFLQMLLKVLEPTQLYCLSGLLAVSLVVCIHFGEKHCYYY